MVGSNHEVRLALAEVFGALASCLISNTATLHLPSEDKRIQLPFSIANELQMINELMQLMSVAFLKGGLKGFLKNAIKRHSLESQKHIRIGIIIGYIQVATQLGGKWLEKNLQFWIKHMVENGSRLGAISMTNELSQANELIFMRNCIFYLLECTLGQQLSAPNQIVACKLLSSFLAEFINKFDCTINSDEEFPLNSDVFSSAYAATLCLKTIGSLVCSIGTSVEPLFTDASGIMETVFACLLHPVFFTRVSASWCIKCVLRAIPSLGSSLVDRCISRLEYMKNSPEALTGFSLTLAVILTELRNSFFILTLSKCQQIFKTAESLLKTAEQNVRFTQNKVFAGWMLISALITQETAFVKTILNQFQTLLCLFFPRSIEEAKNEKCRGDVFTWEGTFEARSGAFATLLCFIRFCPDLIDLDFSKKIVFLIEVTLTTLSSTNELLTMHGIQLRSNVNLLRLRLYNLLTHLKVSDYESSYSLLLTELVADITLNDNFHLSYRTSLVVNICTALRFSFLTGWTFNSQHSQIEMVAYFPHSFSPSLENDPFILVLDPDIIGNKNFSSDFSPASTTLHKPLPVSVFEASLQGACLYYSCGLFRRLLWWLRLQVKPELLFTHHIRCVHVAASQIAFMDQLSLFNIFYLKWRNNNIVALLDSAITLFSRLLPMITSKHKFQIIQHFHECLNTQKPKVSSRVVALQINIISAICCAMKCIGENKSGRIDSEKLKKEVIQLIRPFVNSEHVVIKCLAVETVGRIAQAVISQSDPTFIADNASFCFDQLRALSDERSRVGNVLVLGCLHYYMGSLGSSQHLNTCVSMLLTLAQDIHFPYLQAWSTMSLSLIASSGGGMFRFYVEPCISLCIRLLLNTQILYIDIIRSVARLTSALITAIGPELSTTAEGIDATRSSFLLICSMLIDHRDFVVKSDGVYCVQQLHLFAHRFIQLDQMIPIICDFLNSGRDIIRKAAISFFCQLLQRDAKRVHECVNGLVMSTVVGSSTNESVRQQYCPLYEKGIGGLLFDMLDTETDIEMRKNIKESITFLVQSTCTEILKYWLNLCKDIIASNASYESQTLLIDNKKSNMMLEDDDYDIGLSLSTDEDNWKNKSVNANKRKIIPHRSLTRLFAFKTVYKIMIFFASESSHFDLAVARKEQLVNPKQDFLVFYVSDFIKMGFIGSTSDNTLLRLAGLKCLHDVITCFSYVEEPEFPGHYLLEQFQAQISAALRPAFSSGTSCDVMALACEVCSKWICSGVSQDIKDLCRIHQLLISSFHSLKNVKSSNENLSIVEKLSILKAWAEIYIRASDFTFALYKQDKVDAISSNIDDKRQKMLNELVLPEIQYLIGYWICVLRDITLLSLPTDFIEWTSCEVVSARIMTEYYKECYLNSWESILLASSIWLSLNNFSVESIEMTTPLCAESGFYSSLISCESKSIFNLILSICVESLYNIKHHTPECNKKINTCMIALCNIFECKWAKLELVKDSRLLLELLSILNKLLLTHDDSQIQVHCSELALSIANSLHHVLNCGGNLLTDSFMTSFNLSVIEFSIVILLRQIPGVNLSLMKAKPNIAHYFKTSFKVSAVQNDLIQNALQLLMCLQGLCAEERYLVILPSIFFVLFSALKHELINSFSNNMTPISKLLLIALCKVCPNAPTNEKSLKKWKAVIQSAVSAFIKLNMKEISKPAIILSLTVFLSSSVEKFNSLNETNVSKEYHIISLFKKDLFSNVIKFFKECLNLELINVEIECIRNLNTLFRQREFCGLFAQEFGAMLCSKLEPYILDETKEMDPPVFESFEQSEVDLVKEVIGCLESLVNNISEDKSRLIFILLVRSLARFLLTNPIKDLNEFSQNVKNLHEFSFQRINALGAQNPGLLKKLLNASPSIKIRIEKVANERALWQMHQHKKEHKKSVDSASTINVPPKIKLINFI